jgi:hypothetical protein
MNWQILKSIAPPEGKIQNFNLQVHVKKA